MKRVKRLFAWFRFEGWRNAYWQEQWMEANCPHFGPLYISKTGTGTSTDWLYLCVDCGASIGTPL